MIYLHYFKFVLYSPNNSTHKHPEHCIVIAYSFQANLGDIMGFQSLDFQRLGEVERGWLKQLHAVQNEASSCRWIEDNPKAERPHCGAATKDGSSYCEEHHARAYSNRPLKPIAIPKNVY